MRLVSSSHHQVPEDPIIDFIEPQRSICTGQHVIEQAARGGLHSPGPVALLLVSCRCREEVSLLLGRRLDPSHDGFRIHSKIECFLGRVVEQLPTLLQQHAELRLGMRGAEVLDDR